MVEFNIHSMQNHIIIIVCILNLYYYIMIVHCFLLLDNIAKLCYIYNILCYKHKVYKFFCKLFTMDYIQKKT